MASVQQLEKLYQVKKIFQADRSLESVVASNHVEDALRMTETLIKQRAFLREERRRLRIATEKLEERKRAMGFISQPDFIGDHFKISDGSRKIRINVGGLLFETYDHILQKDPTSLLCQLCNDEPPVMPDPDGCFVFNRDWWLFRYILIFLRDGTLPEDRSLLAQLYQEAHFWGLTELMNAIEEGKLHLHDKVDKEGNVVEPVDKMGKPLEKKWWQTIPNWWKSVLEAEAKAKQNASRKTDWWTGSIPSPQTLSVPSVGVLKPPEETKSTWGNNNLVSSNHIGHSPPSLEALARQTSAVLDESDRELQAMLAKKHPPLPVSKLPGLQGK